MKLIQNGLFIDEIWAKIVVGTLIYHWNSILAVGSQIGSNLAVGSLYNHWNRIWVIGSTRAWSRPSDHARERSDISLKKSAINWSHSRFSIKIVDLLQFTYRRYIANFLAIFYEISLLRFFFHEISCRPFPIHYISVIYRRYIPTFSSLVLGGSSYFIGIKQSNIVFAKVCLTTRMMKRTLLAPSLSTRNWFVAQFLDWLVWFTDKFFLYRKIIIKKNLKWAILDETRYSLHLHKFGVVLVLAKFVHLFFLSSSNMMSYFFFHVPLCRAW